MDQRVAFIADWLRAEWTMTELAERYGISRKTAFKWVERYAEDRILMTVPKLDDLESDAAKSRIRSWPNAQELGSTTI